MYRYVAFIRRTRTHAADDAMQSLTEQFRRIRPVWESLDVGNGLSLFHVRPPGRSATAAVLPGKRGVILGTLFPKNLQTPPCGWHPQFDEVLAEDILQTRGMRLSDDFWGGYIAFLGSRHGDSHYVLRDCSGKIPCYSFAYGSVTVVTSNMNDLAGIALPSFSVNTRYLAGFIFDAELAHRECALSEVTELLAGECLELTSDGARQFAIWDPRRICRVGTIENFDEASRQVRNVTQACVNCWASKYDTIVHLLSGGLDSAAVLGCLKHSPHRPLLTCLHVDSGAVDASEVDFARLTAAAAGVELIVQSGYSQDTRYDERVFRLPKAPKPVVANLALTIESDSRNLVPSQVRAEAVWDGQGGDHLFFDSRAPFEAVDYAFQRRFNGSLSLHLRGAIRQSGLSYWGVVDKSIRLGLLRGKWRPEHQYDRETSFLNPEIVPSDIVDYVWQPWAANASDLAPGKRWQICLLAGLIHRHRPVPELQYATEHHPLFSQPLFELCLRIPIYILVQGGIRRALERAAFRDCIPERIIRRENKGTVTTSVMSTIRGSLPFIRDLLLDGVLVKERIIQRSSMEPYLLRNRPMTHRALWPFLSCIAAEVWIRNWTESSWRL